MATNHSGCQPDSRCGTSAYRDTLGEIIVALIQAVAATTGRAWMRLRQRAQARAVHRALRQLDDHTLHDLGFERSEITSVAAEMSGEAEHTRLRVPGISYGLPK